MSTQDGYELFDHTADVGIQAWGVSLAQLLEQVSRGLYSVIADFRTSGKAIPVQWQLEGEDQAELLHDYLSELLFLFEEEGRILLEPQVQEFSEKRLIVEGQAEAVNEANTNYHHEIKAITYHELDLHKTSDGYQARIIVDI
jgi:SHS2 domain-containing protein